MRRTDQLTDRPNGPSRSAARPGAGGRARRRARWLAGLRPRTLATMAALALAAVVAPAGLGIAGAQDVPPPREYGESGVTSGVVRIEAGSSWLPVGSEGGTASGSSCATSSVKVIIQDDFAQPVNGSYVRFGDDGTMPFLADPGDLPADLDIAVRRFSPTGRWYEVMCDGLINLVPEGGPYVTIAGLMDQAMDQVDPPEPELAIVPADFHVTQLESWLAVEPVYWNDDYSERVESGRVWVVGRADPYQVVWNPGDGSGDLPPCEGPGTVWEAGLDEDANTCGYTYRRSSAGAPGDAFTLTATVSFEVSATSNAPGAVGASFPDLIRTTSLEVQVGEIQAVND